MLEERGEKQVDHQVVAEEPLAALAVFSLR